MVLPDQLGRVAPAPLVTCRTFVPSTFITKTSPFDVNAICDPSGDQAGEAPLGNVTGLVPSTFATWMWRSAAAYATFVPSGDSAGWLPLAPANCVGPKPSALLRRSTPSAVAIGAPCNGGYSHSPPGPVDSLGAPAFATWWRSSVSSCAADAPGLCSARSAAAPARCGAAADVPANPLVPHPVKGP